MKKINYRLKLTKYMSATLIGILFLIGCGQDDRIGLDATDSIAPGLPSNIKVEILTVELSSATLLLKMTISYV